VHHKGFIVAVSAVAALGGLLFGFDTAVISGAIPYIKPFFGLDENTLGWAVGSLLIGCGAGALLRRPARGPIRSAISPDGVRGSFRRIRGRRRAV
jgi:MFS family permease